MSAVRWLGQTRLGAPRTNVTEACHKFTQPTAWTLPPGIRTSACADLINFNACLQIATDALTRVDQPFWGMPVPNLYEQSLLAWLLRYGWFNTKALQACTVTLNSYGAAYDAVNLPCTNSQECAEKQHLTENYPVSFQTWLEGAPTGVVIAERRVRPREDFGGFEWDVGNSKFYAPLPDPDFEDYVPPGVSIYIADNMRAYLTGLKALMLGQEGKLSDVRDWFVVYAPNLSNAPTEWS
jgi:hypothetical protein